MIVHSYLFHSQSIIVQEKNPPGKAVSEDQHCMHDAPRMTNQRRTRKVKLGKSNDNTLMSDTTGSVSRRSSLCDRPSRQSLQMSIFFARRRVMRGWTYWAASMTLPGIVPNRPPGNIIYVCSHHRPSSCRARTGRLPRRALNGTCCR